jgi:hypothetical protein
MGTYINIGNAGFQRARNSEYVDKSQLIAAVNKTLFTEHCFSCVSRCRRFGKSMAAKMLCAYYDHSCDSRSLFADLMIAGDPTFEEHLNKYAVIYLDITNFVSQYKTDDIVEKIDAALLKDVSEAYPDVAVQTDDSLMDYMLRVSIEKGECFVFIIDEWDAICREFAPGTKAMDTYVGWLRRMFKSQDAMRVFAGVYMTGILPIKKYKTESALNNFTEYSMVSPRNMASYFGFTKDEVHILAEKHGMDFDELEKWYDGYQIGDQISMFNPNSVMDAVYYGHCDNNWWGTSSIHAFDDCINKNFDGVLDELTKLFEGKSYKIYTNNLNHYVWGDITSKKDVFTALVHFGYLTYNKTSNEYYVPNYETLGRLSAHVGSLVGINYDKKEKTHKCQIERIER